ncbi:MAG: LOG family protein [Ornithinimicrobium sp.]
MRTARGFASVGGPAGRACYEVDTQEQLRSVLESGRPLVGARLQGLDLREHEATLLERRTLQGLIVLGGQLSARLEQHLRRHGAVIFPSDPNVPIAPYRGSLYTPHELYAGLDRAGYAETFDARTYSWSQDASIRHDAYVSVLRAIHDDSMSDALHALLSGRHAVGVMGGHALQRGTEGFASAADLGHQLARGGYVVITGGGPGAMEAANLGSWAPDDATLAQALDSLSSVPTFTHGPQDWITSAFAALHAARATPGDEVRSVGIPTWHFGHEPPNVFSQRVAKFFSNALREDVLLDYSTAGLVVLPGAAGTVQEIFQMVTRLYYETVDLPRPMILVGRRHWTEDIPVWPLLLRLGHDRPMGGNLHLVDDVDAVMTVLAGLDRGR